MSEQRTLQIKDYQEKTDSAFTDYTRFQGDDTHRAEQKAAFIAGREYTPTYQYEKLDSLTEDIKLRDKKSAIYEAVLELEAAKNEPGVNLAELELYENYHELRLKKIMLVEAARYLHTAQTSGEWEVAKDTFATLNREVYGEFDTPTYLGMIAAEHDKVQNFIPADDTALRIKADLEESLGAIDTHGNQEKPLMDDEVLQKMHDVVMHRYGDIFAAIPDTDDTVYYNAQECADIINGCLEVGGLAAKGWKAVVDPAKSNPSTHTTKRLIQLPASTRRTASELRRLDIHEQEDHARRGENGAETGFKPLKLGTADYADVEEGLGVMLECAVAGTLDNPSFDRARDRYITAGLALGADGKPRDARQVYEILWRTLAIRQSVDGEISAQAIAKARDQAYGHVENAFRSTAFWMRGVIYTKLKVYYEGLRKNADYFTEHSDDIDGALDRAMIGKCNHTDPHELANITNALEARKAV